MASTVLSVGGIVLTPVAKRLIDDNGRSQAITIVGVAGGPLLIGWLYDLFGSYEVPYVSAAALCAVGASVLFVAGPASVAADE